jgi:hypothetical protein
MITKIELEHLKKNADIIKEERQKELTKLKKEKKFIKRNRKVINP